MKNKSKSTRKKYLIFHYLRLGAWLVVIILLIIAGRKSYLENKAQKLEQAKKIAAEQQTDLRLNNLEVKVQDIEYAKTAPQELGLSPVQFKKNTGSSTWEIFDNDYHIGQIASNSAVTPKIFKEAGNIVYIAVYSVQTLQNAPIKIFELIRPINILKSIFEQKSSTAPEIVYDINVANRYLLFQQGTKLKVFDFYENKNVWEKEISAQLGSQFQVNSALFNESASMIAFSAVKTTTDQEVLSRSKLFIVNINNSVINEVADFPSNQECYLSAFKLLPEWKCSN